MDLRNRDFYAYSIAGDADTETKETYQDKIGKFESQKKTYMPLPKTEEFYHVADDWMGKIRSEQWIEPETHLLDTIELLQDNPFLLITEWEGGSQYGFVNRSDINCRVAREMIYPLIAEFEDLIASRIKSEFDSRELFQNLSDRTVGSWIKDEEQDIELHIAESMDLGDMDKVLKESEERLAKCCGFESKEELEDMDSIRELRNKIMHANHTLVRDVDDIREMISNIERVQELIDKANTGAAFN